jgi:alkylation response protein AidB-like acyl-CoA dehydrogenase
LDFQLNEEQLQLKKTVREFAEREILPNVMKWDEASEFPLATIKELGKLGLMGMIFPAEYGGAGMGYVEYVTAIAELSRVDGSVGIILAAHTSLCSNHIFLAGNETQKKKYVSRLATGEFIGAWGLTEPSSGSDAGSARMTAVRKGNNWVLNGTKTFITNGHYADAVVVIAVTDRSAHTHGLSAFIVEKGTKGFRPGKKENKLGLRYRRTDLRRLRHSSGKLVGCRRPRLCGLHARARRRPHLNRRIVAGHGRRRIRSRAQIC